MRADCGTADMARRTDSNQRDIVNGLRVFGAAVLDLHIVGRGCPDLLVYYGGHYFLFEIKSEHGTFTPAENQFQRDWPGPVYTVRSIEDAIQTIMERIEDD